MKKFLLLAAVVAAAFAGNAQDLQLTKAWQTTAPALANTRQGIALDGKFIINNKVAGTLTAYDANGATAFGVTEATASFPAIAKDQAGNIIVRVDNNWPGSFKADTILFKIFPAGGGDPIAVEGNLFAGAISLPTSGLRMVAWTTWALPRATCLRKAQSIW